MRSASASPAPPFGAARMATARPVLLFSQIKFNTYTMIQLLLLVPIIGSLILLVIPETKNNNNSNLKDIAIFTSIINLIISILLWVQFDSSTSDYQFVSEFTQLSFCHFNFGVDGISLYYVLLTTFITPIALVSNYNNINSNVKFFFISFLLLETLQIAVFVVLDLFLFYVFFESVLPVLFIIILVYGSGKNKIRSALLFFLYTLAGSLFMLLAVLQIYSHIGSTDFQLISLSEISLESQKILWLGFFLAFAVKTPLWPLTGWLYRAHADSPLAGSILLAGTILKFATYGYIRILINFLPDASNYFGPLVQTIAIVTLIYSSFTTIIQQDTKSLVAYSSIAHMSVVMLGLFSNTIQGIEGAILLSLAHGFVSPALFICVGGVIYERTGTRIIQYIRGLATYMPCFTILFFIFTLSNTGIPLSLNFLGEQLSLIGIWDRNPIMSAIGATGIVLSACYSIYLYNRVSYGVYSPHLKLAQDITRREFNLLIALLIPTIILGIFPNVILDSLHISVSPLLYFT
jgi:NADH-ubiquinone oxidoreductase chain 4